MKEPKAKPGPFESGVAGYDYFFIPENIIEHRRVYSGAGLN
jgi:hypothetical protein